MSTSFDEIIYIAKRHEFEYMGPHLNEELADLAVQVINKLEVKIAEIEQTLSAACNREGDCIVRHIEGGVCCCTWIGRDAAQKEDQQ